MQIDDEKMKRAMKKAEGSEIFMIALITALEYSKNGDTTHLENILNK